MHECRTLNECYLVWLAKSHLQQSTAMVLQRYFITRMQFVIAGSLCCRCCCCCYCFVLATRHIHFSRLTFSVDRLHRMKYSQVVSFHLKQFSSSSSSYQTQFNKRKKGRTIEKRAIKNVHTKNDKKLNSLK